jgi:hypothetical protein
MASQLRWTSKSVDLLDGSAGRGIRGAYYAGYSSTLRAVATTAHWSSEGCKGGMASCLTMDLDCGIGTDGAKERWRETVLLVVRNLIGGPCTTETYPRIKLINLF